MDQITNEVLFLPFVYINYKESFGEINETNQTLFYNFEIEIRHNKISIYAYTNNQ